MRNMNINDFTETEITSLEHKVISNEFFEPKMDSFVMTTDGPKKITKLFIKGFTNTFKIEFNDGSEETISETHRFRDCFGAWKYSTEMKVGDLFYNINDAQNPLEIKTITKSKNFVVDFEVDDLHEYISSNGLIHHNTISFIADVSGGIEPIFALAYARKIEKEKDRDGNLVYDIAYIADRFFEDYLTQNYSNDKKEILEYTSNNKGSCQGCPLMSKEDLNLFKTAQDLKSTEHLDVLEAVARMTSLSVSKCISKDSIINVNGKLQFIRSLCNNRKEDTFSDINVEIINKDNRVEKSKAFYYNGIKPCKTITLNNGIQFTATKSHKILSKDGWVMMDDVSIGLKILG